MNTGKSLAERTLGRLLPEQAEKCLIQDILEVARGEKTELAADGTFHQWAIAAGWMDAKTGEILIDIHHKLVEIFGCEY